MTVPPAASAAKTWIIRVLMESVSETAEIAALPRLEIIIVSAMPMRAFRNCSTMMGISRL